MWEGNCHVNVLMFCPEQILYVVSAQPSKDFHLFLACLALNSFALSSSHFQPHLSKYSKRSIIWYNHHHTTLFIEIRGLRTVINNPIITSEWYDHESQHKHGVYNLGSLRGLSIETIICLLIDIFKKFATRYLVLLEKCCRSMKCLLIPYSDWNIKC